jgi:hypothetical protein
MDIVTAGTGSAPPHLLPSYGRGGLGTTRAKGLSVNWLRSSRGGCTERRHLFPGPPAEASGKAEPVPEVVTVGIRHAGVRMSAGRGGGEGTPPLGHRPALGRGRGFRARAARSLGAGRCPSGLAAERGGGVSVLKTGGRGRLEETASGAGGRAFIALKDRGQGSG